MGYTDETLQKVNEAFTLQSTHFDRDEQENEAIKWIRDRVHGHVMRYYKKGDRLLEINAGTGTDAIFFARAGLSVYATELSDGMIRLLKEKITQQDLLGRVFVRQLSFTSLDMIEERNFDHIFSNFGGLNCTPDVSLVIARFRELLRPGGTATLVIMPPICPWELMSLGIGNVRYALRRLKKNGTEANIDGVMFRSYYFSPSTVMKMFGRDFKRIRLEGLGSITPPPQFLRFSGRWFKRLRILRRVEQRIAFVFPFNSWADHYILTMQFQP